MVLAPHLAIQAREALAFVNSVRAEYKKPPLKQLKKGEIGEASSCAVAASLSVCGEVCVGPEDAAIDDRDFDMPPAVVDFVWAFDAGEYPHLVKGGL